MPYEAEFDEMNEERFILENWGLLSKETRSMLRIFGVAPVQNGKQ